MITYNFYLRIFKKKYLLSKIHLSVLKLKEKVYVLCQVFTLFRWILCIISHGSLWTWWNKLSKMIRRMFLTFIVYITLHQVNFYAFLLSFYFVTFHLFNYYIHSKKKNVFRLLDMLVFIDRSAIFLSNTNWKSFLPNPYFQ